MARGRRIGDGYAAGPIVDRAEQGFHAALAMAYRQQARSFGRRAALSLVEQAQALLATLVQRKSATSLRADGAGWAN